MRSASDNKPSDRSPGALRFAAAAAVRFDRTGVSIWSPLRAAAGCVITLVVALAIEGDAGAAASTIGALLVAIPSISSTARRPLGTMTATMCGLALSTFVGSATAGSTWVHLPILVLWAFAGGLLIALGDTGGVVGTQAMMAFIVFGRFAEPLGGAGKLAASVAVGGAFQILLTASTHWPIALLAQRKSVAEAYRRLSEVAIGDPERSGIPAGTALDTAASDLATPTLVRRTDVGVLRSLVDEGRRIRIELAVLAGLRLQRRRIATDSGATEGADAPEEVVELALVQAAQVLADIAAAVTGAAHVSTSGLDQMLAEVHGAAMHSAARDTDELSSAGSGATAGSAVTSAIVGHLDALAGQLRAAAALATEASGGLASHATGHGKRLARGVTDRVVSQAATLRANLSFGSTACRHAIRLAVVVPLAELLADHTTLQRGYWVPLTAAIVLRPDFGTTFSRGFARLAGTVVGVGITGVLVVGGHLQGAPAIVSIGVLAFGGLASFRASYAAYSAFLTGVVVLLVNFATPGAHSSLATAGDRLLDTVIGGALALVVYLVWPTWTTDEARHSLAEVVADERAYLHAVLAGVAGEAPLLETEARALSRKLRLARTNCEALISRSLAEPQARRVDSTLAAGVLAGLRRLSLATHVLRTTYMPGKALAPLPEIGPLAHALDEALAGIVVALTDDTPVVLAPLRTVHTDLVQGLAQREGTELLIVETDELVDAVDTLGSLLGAGLDAATGEPA